MTLSKRTRALVALLAIAVPAGTAYAATPDSHAGHVHGRTIHLREATEVPQPPYLDLGKPGPTVGDVVVVTDRLLADDGRDAGSLRQVCTVTVPGTSVFTSEFECSGSISLDGGTLVVEGPFVPVAPEQAQAVTGGTGAFATARGEAIIRSEADEITIHLR
jgi:hypothetical protein